MANDKVVVPEFLPCEHWHGEGPPPGFCPHCPHGNRNPAFPRLKKSEPACYGCADSFTGECYEHQVRRLAARVDQLESALRRWYRYGGEDELRTLTQALLVPRKEESVGSIQEAFRAHAAKLEAFLGRDFENS